MNKFIVIGNPIKHSKSPLLFNYVFKKLNINAVYDAIDIKTEGHLKNYINKIKLSDNIKGINLTIPYKEKTIKYINELDEKSKTISAINCIVNQRGILKGFNTDSIGFDKLLEKYKIDVDFCDNIVIGSGGSARAIIFSLINNAANNIYILSRNHIKALQIIEDFKPICKNVTLQTFNKHPILDNCNIINCTPIGLDISANTSIIKYLPNINYNYIIDINYNSNLKEFDDFRGEKINGNAMFIFQALASLELWFESKISNKLDYYEIEKIISNVK